MVMRELIHKLSEGCPKEEIEALIERSVEGRINSLDRRYMNSNMSEAEYKAKVEDVNAWAAQQMLVLNIR